MIVAKLAVMHAHEPTLTHDDLGRITCRALVMVAASHGQHKPCAGSESDTCLHIPDALGPQNMGRTTRGQYRATGRFVLRSARFDDVATEVTAKGFKR